jgi:hypothetical protein
LYYGSSLPDRIDDAERAIYARRGDRFWLLGSTLLFLAPSLVLFTISLNFGRGCVVVALDRVPAVRRSHVSSRRNDAAKLAKIERSSRRGRSARR